MTYMILWVGHGWDSVQSLGPSHLYWKISTCSYTRVIQKAVYTSLDVESSKLVDLSLPPRMPVDLLILYAYLGNQLNLLVILGLLASNIKELEHLFFDEDLDHNLEQKGGYCIVEVVLHLRELEIHSHKEKDKDQKKCKNVVSNRSTHASDKSLNGF